MKTLKTKSNIFLSDEKDDLSEEFWHSKEENEHNQDSSHIFSPKFKPRGPLYQRKAKINQKNINSEQKETINSESN